MTYKHTPSLRTVAENNDTALLTGCVNNLNSTLDQLATQPARSAAIRAIQVLNGARKNIAPPTP
jgi:hypothetical protein